ncbi:chromosome segregation protein SMC [Armatimonas sp.]|uniref:chromosome segregation protein SMC n=2 Tax=Armatimonas sp. TaxID=1872638 RepID=UPI00374D082E
MRLKRLTLHGFKTFADKTEIEFVPGVTCIVGPNGSGKSNLLDALVWCLGEQKASNLRATNARDVIFAGSSKRKPMGMAEVTLTVDNEDRFLPLDFSEVSVTRRIYRSGESEFLLNKVACRLKDIADLFTDTGVGRGAYAIVNQSEIDGILSAKPEDRRELFEEAAGIKKYRVKKREAQRKLENTEINLIRVRDILGELNTQVEPLRQQADVARTHNALTERLRAVEVGQLAADYKRAKDELAELERAVEAAKKEADALGIEAEELEASALGLGQRISDAESQMDAARIRQQLTMTQVERLESRIALAEERKRSARQTLKSLATDLETLDSDKLRLATETETLKTEATRAETGLAAKTKALADAESVVREADKALGELSRMLAGQEADYLSLARKLAAQKAERDSLRERIQRRHEDIREAQERVQLRDVEVAAALESQQQLVQALEAAREEQANVKVALETVSEPRYKAAVESVSALEELRRRKERELAGSESRLRVLEETEAMQEGYFAGVKTALSAAAEGKIAGRFTLFADAIKVPAAFETAIEVALGGSLQDIITDTELQAKAGIRFLHETRGGRATFLPLDKLRDQPVPPALRAAAKKFKGVYGSAAELISFSDDVSLAVRVHLARVLVVEDLDTATEVSRQIERDWARIVTLSGELVVPTGAITGGRTGRQWPNLLSRKREIGELEEAVDTGRAALERIATQQTEARAASEAARQAVREAESVIQRAREAVLDTERRVQNKKTEAERLQKEALQLQTRAGQLAASGEADASREATLSAAIEDADRTDESVLASREELTRRQASLTVRRDEARDQARTIATEAASLRERVVGLSRDAKRAEEGALRATITGEERRRRAVEAETVITTEDAEAIQRAGERDTAKKSLDEAALEVEKWRERRQALVNENFQLTERIRLVQRTIGFATERGQQARLRAARVETQAETVGQRLQDEYDLHPDSAVALTGGAPVEKDVAQEIARLRREIRALGTVNLGAIEEYERVSERFRFLTEQKADLDNAKAKLLSTITEIDDSTRGVFAETFDKVNVAFQKFFTRLFGGGSTDLVMTDPSDVLETGIDILAQPPGKKRQNLSLLSGGERALTATALLFAFLEVRPAPFCVLDEVDAPLDGANVEKFADLVREFGQQSQFILITHNATTMEAAPLWYGVTMQEPGVSRGISMRVPESPPTPSELVSEPTPALEPTPASFVPHSADPPLTQGRVARSEE